MSEKCQTRVLFREAIGEGDRIEPVETLSALLNRLASGDAALAAFLRTPIVGRLDSIQDGPKEEFESLGFHVMDEWGDVEMEITKIELNGEPHLIDISEPRQPPNCVSMLSMRHTSHTTTQARARTTEKKGDSCLWTM